MNRIMELADTYASEERIERNAARAALAAEVERVEAELERHRTQLHTCGPTCSRAGCVNARLTAELDTYRIAVEHVTSTKRSYSTGGWTMLSTKHWSDVEEELAAAQADAQRYRWLLDFGKPNLWVRLGGMNAYDDVEAAIDAAILESKK